MEKYKFNVIKGGFTQYEGILSNAKEISEINIDRNSTPRKCEVTFVDGCKYTLTANVEEDSGTAKITNISEEWGEPSV